MNDKPYFIALSSSEKMALVTILGEVMLHKELTQTFIDVTAGPDSPAVSVGSLFQLLVDLDPRRPETPEDEIEALRAWQRTAIRTLSNTGALTAMAEIDRRAVAARMAWMVKHEGRVVRFSTDPMRYDVYLPGHDAPTGTGSTADAAIDAAIVALP